MSARPRIALWHNLPSGGGKRALMEQVKRLKRDIDIDLYTTTLVDDTLFPIAPHCQKVTCYPVTSGGTKGWDRIRRRYRQAADLFRVTDKAAAAIDLGGYHAVLVASCMVEHSPSLLWKLRTRTVYYMQEGLREWYEEQPALEGIKDVVGRTLKHPELIRRMLRDKRAVRAANTLVTNSRYTQSLIQRWYGMNSTVCYPGVDTEVFYPFQKPVSEKERHAYGFLSVGRLSRVKGHDYVISVLGALPSQYRLLTIAFDQDSGTERDRLSTLATELGVTVRFSYRMPQDELRHGFQTALAVVCGQHREPFGLIPIETMACKGLVAATEEGGFQETIQDGVTGFFLPRDPVAAASRLLATLQDSKLTAKLRTQGHADVQSRWTWEVHAKQMKQYLLHG